jgi:tRNA-specific 2-thiouridylase
MTDTGQVAGRHEGLMYYTRGQRQGIGVGGGFSESEGPWYVAEKDLKNNTLIISQGHTNPLLYNRRVYAGQLHWITGEQPANLPKQLTAKIRYRQKDQKTKLVAIKDGIASIIFDDPQYAPAPGQSVVFYSGTECLGGAIIESYE